MTTAAVPTTLAALMARTATDGNCRVWLGHCDSVGSPKITIHYQKYFVRRLVWQLLHGPIAKGGQIGATCGTPGCTAPAHLVCRTQSQALKGRPIPIERRIRIALTQRANAATKLTPEQRQRYQGVVVDQAIQRPRQLHPPGPCLARLRQPVRRAGAPLNPTGADHAYRCTDQS